MPLSLVKSLPSSTSALAGSHAAQHRVSCLFWAAAGWLPRAVNAIPAPSANAPATYLDHFVTDFRMCFPLLNICFSFPERLRPETMRASKPERAEAGVQG